MSQPTQISIDDAAVDAGATALARFLSTADCHPGDRVALLAGNIPEHLSARLAASSMELVMIPINTSLAPPEIDWILGNARPRVVLSQDPMPGATCIADAIAAGRASSARIPEIDASRLGATILYTSGTTGRPKGCLRTAAQEDARREELTATYGIGPGDVHIVVCPLPHSGPGIFSRTARAAGARTVLMPRFTAEGFLQAVAATRATLVFMVPTQCERLMALPEAVRRAHDVSSLRAVVVAGAPFAPATKRRMIEWLGDGVLWEFYGSSETGTVTVLGPGDHLTHPGTVGRPPPSVSIRLLDEDRRPVPTGELGEVFVRSPTVMAGYLDEHGELTALDAVEGHASVGDLGRVDEDGFLTLIDRKHDTIISGGSNVYPAEVEHALFEHPRVLGAVAFALPDPDWGQIVAAAVALDGPGDPDAEAAGLRAFLRDHLAAYKLPRAIAIVDRDHLPIGSTGKPLRRLAAAELAHSPLLIRIR